MDSELREFTEALWQYYAEHGRSQLPWRQPEIDGSFDPYKIMVSELMLQQTQVTRVITKFHEFLMKFPTVQALAAAPLGEVLKAWSGLGYNRRAKFLWQAATLVANDLGGVFPQTVDGLVRLPGVGKNTAGAILAYAFNEPVVFIETNVRTVYIHRFFNGQTAVPDKAILEQVARTLAHEQPREFYWALMDYGSFLKQTVGNLSKFSAGYAQQSTFQGSKRQIRGQVLKLLGEQAMTLEELQKIINDERLIPVIKELIAEQLISRNKNQYSL